jgi:hypothetical protein
MVRRRGGRPLWLLAAMALAALLLGPVAAMRALADQPCNPVIDGTYCATQMRAGSGAGGSSGGGQQIQSLSNDLSIGSNPTATFGGITFSGDTTCIGILRRGACN